MWTLSFDTCFVNPYTSSATVPSPGTPASDASRVQWSPAASPPDGYWCHGSESTASPSLSSSQFESIFLVIGNALGRPKCYRISHSLFLVFQFPPSNMRNKQQTIVRIRTCAGDLQSNEHSSPRLRSVIASCTVTGGEDVPRGVTGCEGSRDETGTDS